MSAVDEPETGFCCDFCNEADPAFGYKGYLGIMARCTLEGPEFMPTHKAWAACHGCAQLIDARDTRGLLRRCVSIMCAQLHVPCTAGREQVFAMTMGDVFGAFMRDPGPRLPSDEVLRRSCALCQCMGIRGFVPLKSGPGGEVDIADCSLCDCPCHTPRRPTHGA